MFCGKCGNEIAAGIRFCGVCGWKVPETAAKPVCKGCGAEIVPGTKFCGVCGAKVEEEPVAPLSHAQTASVQAAPIQLVAAQQPVLEEQPASATAVPVQKVPPATEAAHAEKPTAKSVRRVIRITTPDGSVEVAGTGLSDGTFLCGAYKMEVLADDEPCASAMLAVETEEK